jgi:hypothetical protein
MSRGRGQLAVAEDSGQMDSFTFHKAGPDSLLKSVYMRFVVDKVEKGIFSRYFEFSL